MHLSWRAARCGSPPARMGAVAVAFDADDGDDDAAAKSTPLPTTSGEGESNKDTKSSERRRSTRAVWGDDLVVVHGGLGEGRFALGDTWILTSSSVSSSASAGNGAGDGGGGGGWVCLPAAAAAAENENGSSSPPPPPPPRAFHCGAALRASLFVFGGHALEEQEQGGGQRLTKRNDLFELRLDRLEWRRLSSPSLSSSSPSPNALPCPRDFASMCSLPRAGSSGLLLLHGGLDAGGARLGDTWAFDLGFERWTRVETGFVPATLSPPSPPSSSPVVSSSPSSSSLYPLPRYGASLTRVGGRAFLVGGDTGALGGAGKEVELFSFVAGAASAAAARSDGNDDDDEDAPPAWIRLDLPGAPEARRGHAAAALGNWLVVAGGRRLETSAATASANGGGDGLWRGGGLLRRRGSAGTEVASPSKDTGSSSSDDGSGLFSDAFVLDCGGGRVRWRRASGGLGALGEEDEEEGGEEGSNDNDSRAPRREFASLVSLPAIDSGCLLLLGGGDGKGRLLADAQRATPALPPLSSSSHFEVEVEGGPFAGRAPPPPPPPLAPLALRGFGSGSSRSSRSRGRRRAALLLWRDESGGSSGPGTPLSPASAALDDGGGGGAFFFFQPPPLAAIAAAADRATEAKMVALRARLGICRSSDGGGGGGRGGGDGGGRSALPPPSASSVSASPSSSSTSRLGDRARTLADLASLCAKVTAELTIADLRLLLAAVKRMGEEARRRREQQRNDYGDSDDGNDRNEIDLFCSIQPPEAFRLGSAKALQQAAAAGLRLL